MKIIRPNTVLDTGAMTRGSTGTFVGSNGLVQTAAIDAIRINYNPLTLAITGALKEAAATNRLLYSEQFDDAAWTKASTTVTANSAASPDGATTADTIVEVAATAAHLASQNVTITAGTTNTFSVYAKAGVSTRVQIFIDDGSGNGCHATFNLTAGTVTQSANMGTGTGVVATIVAGAVTAWWELTISGVIAPASTTLRHGIVCVNSATPGFSPSYLGVVTNTVFVWGAQSETGAAATSYIPTTTAAVTRSADVVTGSGLVYTSVPEADFALWEAATAYVVGNRVIRTVAGTHSIYQRLVNGTTATAPESDVVNWVRIAPTNRWGMFDQSVSTLTTVATSMTYVLAAGRVNGLALLALDAEKVTISMTANSTIVYSASLDLVGNNAVGDWYQYFYEPVYSVTDVVVLNLLDAALLNIPAYGDGVLTVTISKASGNVALGALVVGLVADLGDTQYQPTVSITDYSKKATDAFGTTVITKLNYSKRLSASTSVKNTAIDNVANLMAQYRSTPLVWVGADNLYTSLIVYGFYKDWGITVDNSTFSTLKLEIEGLT